MAAHVSDNEAKRILTFCSRMIATLRLPPHHLVLSDSPSDDDAHASIDPTDGRYAALLKVASDWEQLEEWAKVHDLTHEVLHLVHAELYSDVCETLRRSRGLSVDLYDTVVGQFHQHFERMVDRLTDVIVEGFDPQWPDEVDGELKSRASSQGRSTTGGTP